MAQQLHVSYVEKEIQFVKTVQLMEKTMAVTEVGSANKVQMDYMKLLVTQMQNQNPLEPMNNDQMTSQLTQISQLEQMESQTSNFAKVLETTEHSYARRSSERKCPII